MEWVHKGDEVSKKVMACSKENLFEDSVLDRLRSLRHDLHKCPEVGFEEFKTASRIAAELDFLGIPYVKDIVGTGIVASIEGDAPGSRTIGFRAELDALPMSEENTFAHRSANAGVMHGCGHDGHCCMLLGLAYSLSKDRGFSGTVRLIFQPAEEGGGGGREMVNKGLFEQFPVDEIYAIHNWPELERNTVGVLDGPMMAAAHTLEFTIAGIGGHGGMPHACTDQLAITAHVLTALNTYVARRVSPASSVVVSMTKIQAGTALTVLPDRVTCDGVIRVLQPSEQERIYEEIPKLIEGIAGAFGATAQVKIAQVYPTTVNNTVCADRVLQTANALGLAVQSNADGLMPSMASEDFSFMLGEVPGCYIWLGQASESLHHPNYDFDDTIMETGIRLLNGLARQP